MLNYFVSMDVFDLSWFDENDLKMSKENSQKRNDKNVESRSTTIP